MTAEDFLWSIIIGFYPKDNPTANTNNSIYNNFQG